jgi:hypothetical protein
MTQRTERPDIKTERKKGRNLTTEVTEGARVEESEQKGDGQTGLEQ